VVDDEVQTSHLCGIELDHEDAGLVGMFGAMDAAETRKKKVREAVATKTYDVFDAYHETGYAQAIARSSLFENVTLTVIALNGIWIAYDTDTNEASTLLEADLQYQLADNIFCVYFVFEWVVRFLSFRRKCDGMQDGWFCFDTFLVWFMIGETWVVTLIQLAHVGQPNAQPQSTESNDEAGILGVLRLFRLLRLARMARMLRSMPELMILIKGMLAAMRSVFFVMCLLLIIMYVFAIIFTQLAKGTAMGAFYFPNIQHSMYSLLIYGTFLDNLAQFCDEIGAESYVCLALVFVFILLASCTVLNMLIGVLCEVVSAVADTEKEEMNLLFVTDKLHNLLYNLDENSDGHISKEEFMAILGFPEAVRALEEVEIDPVAVVDFAEHIFGSGAGKTLSFQQFMEILLNLRNTNIATIKDLVDLKKHFVWHLESLERQIHGKKSSIPTVAGSEDHSPVPGAGVDATVIKDLQARTQSLEESLNAIVQEFRIFVVKHIPGDHGLPRATVLSPNNKSLRNASQPGKQRTHSASRQR